MTTVTATLLTTYVSSLTAANAEKIIDDAINKLNMYGLSIGNLSGTAGSKTLTCSSGEAGAILSVSMAIYSAFYASHGSQSNSLSIPGLSESTSNSSGTLNSVDESAKAAAFQLKTRAFIRTK